MFAGELINKLSNYPSDTEVVIVQENDGYGNLYNVRKVRMKEITFSAGEMNIARDGSEGVGTKSQAIVLYMGI